MIPAERQKRLLNLINQNTIISISSLVDILGVSHMTIRRDIQKLEQEGKVASVSGGVKSLEHLSTEPTRNDKYLLFPAEKANIGSQAAKLIPHNTTIYLDAGTTTLEIARQITEREDLQVITNDFVITNFLIDKGKCGLIHSGGTVNKSNQSSVGQLTAEFLQKISVDIAFISTSSWNLKGLTTPDENKLPVKKTIIESSQTRILVSDSSKYGKNAIFHICPLNLFNTIISDRNLPINTQEAIREMGVELMLV